MFKKNLVLFALILSLLIQYKVFSQEALKYPDYGQEFIGEDKFENFNRKIFNFNLGLNKYIIRPVHILWASIMPEFGMDRIKSATDNIEYPIRLMSSLIQRDFNAVKTETKRFLVNSTIGLGGMFDPAKRFLHLDPSEENMEQALEKCHLKPGPYLVLPVISSTSLRGALGRILDTALNPGSYIATPILAMVKAGLTINKTSYMQPFITMVESTYADPYDIAKKAYGLERHIKCRNFDRIALSDLVPPQSKDDLTKIVAKPANKEQKLAPVGVVKTSVWSKVMDPEILKGGIDSISTENFTLTPDINLENYNPQNPVVDSMRTALFDIPEVNKSIWNELSLWNRSFAQKIKTSSILATENRPEYSFRYILNKDKNAPVAVIYPSIGEGIYSTHSVLWAKLFYDAGYSVVIQGSHFQWEFVKSMPKGYHPGLPLKDSEKLQEVTNKILAKLEKKYECNFKNKVMLGTSFGAVGVLFVGEREFNENPVNDNFYIAICPPVELLYAMNQIDKNTNEWKNASQNLKDKTAQIAAKVLKIYNAKDDGVIENIKSLPFDEEEGKLITRFIMHQKLSDIVFTIEEGSKSSKEDIYKKINNMDYKDYALNYLLTGADSDITDLSSQTGLGVISTFLQVSNNYKIYHSVNDYLTNTNQLKQLKIYAKNKMVLLDNGAHLGFLYRKEFLDNLKNLITLNR